MLRRLNDVDYEVETPGRRREKKIVHINLLKKWNDPQTALLAIVEGETEQTWEASDVGESPGEGEDWEDPLQEASNLEEKLYSFDSKPTGTDLLPELSPNLDASKREELLSLISQYPSVFNDKPGRTTVIQHEVHVGDATPIHQRPYRVPYSRRSAVKAELDKMLAENIIRPSTRPTHRSCWSPRKMGRCDFVWITER